MRLINASTFELEEFFDDRIPPYAILSHTWGEDEVDFRHFYNGAHRHGVGWAKIVNSCEQAKRDDLGYAWVDTCCIDKSSSAELQEAINSMFNYYRDAAVCYAYLVDVTDEQWNHQFRESRWFKRGWTLQELLAPREVNFFANIGGSIPDLRKRVIGWKWIGRRGQSTSSNAPIIAPAVLGFQISEITRIGFEFVVGMFPLSDASVATRMAWAAGRQTTRREDRAYSLLGIFDINMPLLYGEGHRAFERLQKEIMAVSDDETIMAWHYGLDFGKCAHGGLFAQSPDCYEQCIDLVPIPSHIARRKHYTLTNKGLWMKGVVVPGSERSSCLVGLNCTTREKLAKARDALGTGEPGAIAIDFVKRIRLGSQETDFSIWRPSTSVPFAANSDVFMTRLRTAWLKEENPRGGGEPGLINEGCRFYIEPGEPAVASWPFVLLIQSSVLASLQDADIKMIKIDPISTTHVIYRLDEKEWDNELWDQSRTSIVHKTVTLVYQRDDAAWYETEMRINLEASRIRRNAERDYINNKAAGISETILEEPEVRTTTYLLPPGFARDELHNHRRPGRALDTTTGVRFQIKVLTYKRRVMYNLACVIDPQD